MKANERRYVWSVKAFHTERAMKQAILVAPEQFEIREVEKPSPKKGEALLKVKAVDRKSVV